MKIRIASLVLALGLLITMMSVAFADEAEMTVDVGTDEAAMEELAVFYLDGEPLCGVVTQCINSTYYVTLDSIMPLLDPSAVVEENFGAVVVTAEAVVVTEPVIPEEEAAEVPDLSDAEDGEISENAAADEGEEVTENEPEIITIVSTIMETDPVTGILTPVTSTIEVTVDPVTGEYIPLETPEEAEVPSDMGEAVAEVVDTLLLTAEVGKQYIVANGRYLYVADGVLTLEGKVAVPVRVLAEVLNLGVGYDPVTDCVSLTRSAEIGYLEDGDAFYDAESVYWLSRIIHCESGNQSMDGKIAVGNVVMNRVNCSRFPDTIYDVIFQKNQFSPVASGSIYNEPGAASVIAAKLVLDGAEVLDEVLFFNRTGLKCYASRYRTFVAAIGDHSFYV